MRRRKFLASSALLSASALLGGASLAASATGTKRNAQLANSLLRIDKWLAAHAPKIRLALQPATTTQDLTALAHASSGELPNDFVSLYQWHDGIDRQKIGNFFFGFVLEPAKYIVSRMQGYIGPPSALRYADPGIDQSFSFGRTRIPIADDSAHCFLCVDLAPNREGISGQVIMIDEEYSVALRLCNSVGELVSNFARDLEEGKYTLAQDALEDGDEWLSPERSIDPGNWFNSPTWARAHAFAK